MSKNTNLSFLTDYITADITNGRIGINNASPAYSFDVTGIARTSTSTYLATASGNVGIGTTSPAATLEVAGSVRAYLNSATQTELFAENSVVKIRVIASTSNSYVSTSTNHPMIFETNNTERMRITSTGLVAIGRSTPENGVKLLVADAGGIGMEFSPNANVPNENRLLSYDRVAGTTIPMNYSASIHKLYTGYNNLQTSTKTASSGGNTTFSLGTDYGASLGDNVSGLVIISISQTNSNVTNPSAVWVGTVINPRGSGATLTQISTTKGSGISTVSVSGNLSNQIIVTASTSDGSGYRASMTFIGGGGVS